MAHTTYEWEYLPRDVALFGSHWEFLVTPRDPVSARRVGERVLGVMGVSKHVSFPLFFAGNTQYLVFLDEKFPLLNKIIMKPYMAQDGQIKNTSVRVGGFPSPYFACPIIKSSKCIKCLILQSTFSLKCQPEGLLRHWVFQPLSIFEPLPSKTVLRVNVLNHIFKYLNSSFIDNSSTTKISMKLGNCNICLAL